MSDSSQQSNHEVKPLSPNGVVPTGVLYEERLDGRWNIYIDHHMISGFTRCESYFELSHFHKVLNPTTNKIEITHIKPRAFSFPATIGIWWSKAMEWYHTALAQKVLDKNAAVHIALDAWDEMKVDDEKVNFPFSYEKFGGRVGAIEMMADYYDFSYAYDTVHWKVIAVESGFGRKREVCIGENGKVVVYYIGKPDIVIDEDNRIMPVDNKTKNYIPNDIEHLYKPHAQTAGYIVSTQVILKELGINRIVDRCLVNAAARNAPSDNPRGGKPKRPRFKRIPIHYSVAELEEWRHQTIIKAARLRQCIETGEWTFNDAACHIYGGCEYRAIHAAPPASRPIIIQSAYRIADAWSPYEPED